MSNNQKLFKDAIADAKALREVAVANAKAALEESFMPRIQSMFERRVLEAEELEEKKDDELDEKITYTGDKDDLLDSLDETEDLEEIYDEESMEEDVDLEELFNSLEEEDNMYETMSTDEDAFIEETEMEEDFNLEEILAELEEESSEINEDEDELNENTMFEKATGTEDINEVTVDELRDMIQDAIRAVMGGEEGVTGDEEETDVDFMGGEEGEDDFNIDTEDEEEEVEEKPKKKSKKDELDELFALYERKKKAMKDELEERREYKGSSSEEKMDEVSNAPYGAKGDKKDGPYNKGSKKLQEVDKEKELEEAINVIKTLRSQLNEVNLLNAKLIYVNKIFKANNLTEGQKVNVVNSFDKAQTLNEAKNIYEVLKNTVKTTKVAPKTTLKEHKSFASSVIGGKTAKSPIINADDTITRMQQLAGIIKN